MFCAVCKYWRNLKKTGPVYLCNKHRRRYVWDGDYDYLRQKKRGGKWYKIWESQSDLVKSLEKLGHRVDQEVRPLWAVSKKGVLLPYDMSLPEMKVLIEYQGEQHREEVRFFFESRRKWIAYLLRQKLKKKLARENGWRLIEFYPEDKPFTGKKVAEKLMG